MTQLVPQLGPCGGYFPLPRDSIDDGFKHKSNQHAYDDDPHLAGELAPSVQWFGQVEMHVWLTSVHSRCE